MLTILVYTNSVAIIVHDLVDHSWRNLEEEKILAALPGELACDLANAAGLGEKASDATSGRTYQWYLAYFHHLAPNAGIKRRRSYPLG